MHILVVNNLYPPIMAGGAERIVAYLCEGLVNRGHRVTVVSTCGPHMEPYPAEIRNGVEVIRFFPPNVYWSHDRSRKPGLKKWLWHARDAWNRAAGERLGAVMAEKKPDVMHTHLVDGFSASIWAHARRRGIKVIHTAHDYHLMCPRAFMLTRDWTLCARPGLPCRLYKAWHLRTTRHVDLFASPSQFLLDMHARAGLRARGRAVVANGIPQPAGPVRRVPRPPSRPPRFLMLSRLTVEKGVRVLLEAVARLPPDLPFELAIAGTGPLAEEVQAAAARDKRIIALGFVDGDAKADALAWADYLLLPSLWYENAPVTIVEAAAHGLGLIGSDIGAIPEFVEDGGTGLLFPSGDAAALAAIMQKVARDPRALPHLEARARALAERFTLERMIAQYERHYLSLLDRQPASAAA